MQSLYARAKADNKRILNQGFSADMTITNPATGEQQTVKGFYIDVPLDINPQSGLPVHARRIACSIHLADLTIGNPAEVAGDWRNSFVNNVGETVSGVMETLDLDRTLGMLTFTVKLLTVVP
jgi:hypothetical protein